MAEVAAIYQKYSDNVAKNATITIGTGTPPDDLDNYGPDTLVDDNPAKAAKIDALTGAWVLEFPAAQPLQVASLIHHTFDAGADVKLQGNATNSWGAPSFSSSFTIPPWFATGTTRRWPVNPWMDLTEKAGYNPSGFKFWRVSVTGNSQNIQLGQLWLGATIRRLTKGFQWKYLRTKSKRSIRNVTSYGVETTYARGVTEWKLEGDHLMDEILRAALDEQWMDADGDAHPWLLVPDGMENAAYLVKWLSDIRSEAVEMNRHVGSDDLFSNRYAVKEVSRGLRLGV